ncbi:MAG: hypothetical protein HKO82_01545 [Acidimicrobiia bacterium]|nr:hypothetical protein [Acidimicrobiia bacterium]NNF89056.1 hypothetical protein [Acidimicrobiia bacterium]NNL12356.1 hypothetical protein [Acidimicrobiia bacterium]
MNQEQAFEAVAQANPLPSESAGPGGFLSMTALLERIDERSTEVQTQQRRDTGATAPPSTKRPGWLVPALAGAAAVIVAILVVVLVFTGDDGPDAIEPAPTPTTLPQAAVPTPLEVTNLYNEATAAGDWEALRALYADTAELEVNSVAGETFVERVSLADYVPQTPYDWDGDGSVDGFDGLTDDAARQHAIGTTTFVTCSQVDDVTAACQEVWEGSALSVRGNPHNNWTLTIIDGVITLHVIEVVPRPDNPIDSNLVAGYRTWINDNKPELSIAELFEDISRLAISPDTVPVHRELIAEWQAEQ